MKINNEMTQEQAVALAATEWWVGLPARDVVGFQLFNARLCMPFDVFHEAVQEALGRPVWTHEFAFPDLRAEFLGNSPPPSFEDICALIPPEKRVVLTTNPDKDNAP